MADVVRVWPVIISSSFAEGKFALSKVWLKDHDIEYEIKNHSVLSRSWQTIEVGLTVDQMGELASYLEKAELFSGFQI